jgi:epoxyqueuosine reductase
MKSGVRWTPSDEQMALWPSVSGNTINGVGETRARRPSPVYWHDPDVTPHGRLQRWFYARMTPRVLDARVERIAASELPVPPVSGPPVSNSAEEWTAFVKRWAREASADAVGIAAIRDEWIFEGHSVSERWAIVLAVAHDWDALRTAPEDTAAAEVIRQYARGMRVAKAVAARIRERGHAAEPLGGPMAYPMLLIPAAIDAGLGELGKHGSLIHPTLGSNFRLAAVVTDIPLVADNAIDFGADSFCQSCQACTRGCPPAAIGPDKQMVRGAMKWSVDFDRCLPFFNEHQGCAACLAVCPWNVPGVAPKLLTKLAARRARLAG